MLKQSVHNILPVGMWVHEFEIQSSPEHNSNFRKECIMCFSVVHKPNHYATVTHDISWQCTVLCRCKAYVCLQLPYTILICILCSDTTCASLISQTNFGNSLTFSAVNLAKSDSKVVTLVCSEVFSDRNVAITSPSAAWSTTHANTYHQSHQT